MQYFSIFIVTFDCLAIVYGQMNPLGSTEYCAELKPQTNVTIPEITGRWYGTEVITHREMNYIGNVAGDCIEIVIAEINEEVSGEIQFENPIDKRNVFELYWIRW